MTETGTMNTCKRIPPRAWPAFPLFLCLVVALFWAASPAWAVPDGERDRGNRLETVVFDVDNMTCRLCPITVRRALRKVDGVVKVKAKYEGKGIGWAKVTFDPARTNIEALRKASERAGFPARPRPNGKPNGGSEP